MFSRPFTAWIGCVLALALVFTAAGPAHADSESIPVNVPVPAPGNTTSWTMPLENTSADAASVWLKVTGDAATLPLLVELADPDGNIVLATTPVAELAGRAVDIGALPAGASTVVQARVSMPRDTGNEAQGVSQATTFAFSLMGAGDAGSDGSLPGDLTPTGEELAWALPLAILLLIVGLILAAYRKRKNHLERPALTEGIERA